MGESLPEDLVVPITQEPLPATEEIEQNIRNIIRNHQGEELVRELTIYVGLSLIEVVLTKDPRPKPAALLWKDQEKVETLGRLSTAFIPSDENQDTPI
jgi:hypothetical protein